MSAKGVRRNMVTIKDVARKSGFAATTVSFVLNDAPLSKYIADETKTRIRQAAKDLGYRPNHLARALRSKHSHTVGVVVFDISDPYCAQIVRGVENGFYQSGSYLPLLIDVQNDRARFRRFIGMLLDRLVDGLITLGNSIYPEHDLLETLQQCQIPVVIIGRELEADTVSSVTTDNHGGATAVMEHLYILGHRKIAFIRGPRVFIDSGQRWKGIESFARKVRLPLRENLITELNLRNVGHQGGWELTQRLIGRGKEFTAIVAHDDLTAIGAIRALNEAGRQVPRDCSVIGFDDVPISAYANPPLTTIHQDMEQQGSVGVEILLEALRLSENRNMIVPVHRRITPRLLIRGSTAQPRDQA
jgi:LacI family transcriptional regulator